MCEPSTPRSQATEVDMTNLKSYQTSEQAMKMMLAMQEQHSGVVKQAQKRAGWMFSAQAHCRAAPPMYVCTNLSAQPFYPDANAASKLRAQHSTVQPFTQQQPMPPLQPAGAGHPQHNFNFNAQDPIVTPQCSSHCPAAASAWTQPFLPRPVLNTQPVAWPPAPPRAPLQPQAAVLTPTELQPVYHADNVAVSSQHGGAATADATAPSNPLLHNHGVRMGQIQSADWSYQPVGQARLQDRQCQVPHRGAQQNDDLMADNGTKSAAETATQSAKVPDDACTRYRVSVEAPDEWFKGRRKRSSPGAAAEPPKFIFNVGRVHGSPDRFCDRSFSSPGGSPGAALTRIHALTGFPVYATVFAMASVANSLVVCAATNREAGCSHQACVCMPLV